MTAGDSQRDRRWPLVAPGVWLDLRMAPLTAPGPALFLDRDGVIIEDTGFIADPDQVVLVPEAVSLIRAANAAKVPVLVVTNQSGVDRGRFGWDAFAAVEQRIAELLAAADAFTDATAACPFHPDHTDDYDERLAAWRKPGCAMITALAEALNIALAESWMIGDRARDVAAAHNAGLAGGILIGESSTPGLTPHVVRSAGDAMALLTTAALFKGG